MAWQLSFLYPQKNYSPFIGINGIASSRWYIDNVEILNSKKNVAEILLTQGEALITQLRRANCNSVAIGHLNNLRGHVLPITGDMILDTNLTPYRLALSSNRYRFYKKRTQHISDSGEMLKFNQHHIQNGNIMLDMVVDALHTFTKHQKQTLTTGLAIHDRLTQQLMIKDDVIATKDKIINEKDELIATKDKIINLKDELIATKDKIINEKDDILYELAWENPNLFSTKRRRQNPTSHT